MHNGAITPSTDAERYWFGIARGIMKAKQLMVALKDDQNNLLGTPVYWTKRGAYFFPLNADDNTVDSAYWEFQPPEDGEDYSFQATG